MTTLHCDDIDEARELSGRVYYPHQVERLDRGAPFALDMRAARLGPITLGHLRWGCEVRITTPELDTAYQVNLPDTGSVATSSGRDRIDAGPDVAAVYRPDRGSTMRGWASPTTMLAVKIPRTLLERELENLLGRPVPRPIAFDLRLPIHTGAGLHWARLARHLADGRASGDELLGRDAVAAPLAHGLLTGLLLCAHHPYTEELHAPPAAVHPAAVRRAIGLIEAFPQRPLTVADLADAAGVGVRALQYAFRYATGVTPIAYLHDVRLRRLRQDLRRAGPGDTTVAAAARRWGLHNAGRVAADYRARFGELPSQTLHH